MVSQFAQSIQHNPHCVSIVAGAWVGDLSALLGAAVPALQLLVSDTCGYLAENSIAATGCVSIVAGASCPVISDTCGREGISALLATSALWLEGERASQIS